MSTFSGRAGEKGTKSLKVKGGSRDLRCSTHNKNSSQVGQESKLFPRSVAGSETTSIKRHRQNDPPKVSLNIVTAKSSIVVMLMLIMSTRWVQRLHAALMSILDITIGVEGWCCLRE